MDFLGAENKDEKTSYLSEPPTELGFVGGFSKSCLLIIYLIIIRKIIRKIIMIIRLQVLEKQNYFKE